MADEFEVGDRVEIYSSTVFQDKNGTAFDPDVVTFQVKGPGVSDWTDYVFGTDPEVTNPATGSYILAIDVETAGLWKYYIKGETAGGQNRGAARGELYVSPKEQ